jgi:hypothetical protein
MNPLDYPIGMMLVILGFVLTPIILVLAVRRDTRNDAAAASNARRQARARTTR